MKRTDRHFDTPTTKRVHLGNAEETTPLYNDGEDIQLEDKNIREISMAVSSQSERRFDFHGRENNTSNQSMANDDVGEDFQVQVGNNAVVSVAESGDGTSDFPPCQTVGSGAALDDNREGVQSQVNNSDDGTNVADHSGCDSACSLLARERGDESSCLLYTSPSPRDIRTSRMPSSA